MGRPSERMTARRARPTWRILSLLHHCKRPPRVGCSSARPKSRHFALRRVKDWPRRALAFLAFISLALFIAKKPKPCYAFLFSRLTPPGGVAMDDGEGGRSI